MKTEEIIFGEKSGENGENFRFHTCTPQCSGCRNLPSGTHPKAQVLTPADSCSALPPWSAPFRRRSLIRGASWPHDLAEASPKPALTPGEHCHPLAATQPYRGMLRRKPHTPSDADCGRAREAPKTQAPGRGDVAAHPGRVSPGFSAFFVHWMIIWIPSAAFLIDT